MLETSQAENNRRFVVLEELIESYQRTNQQRFDSIDKRLDRIDSRLDRMDSRFDRIEGEVGPKLQAVYDSRDKVKIEFGWQWSLVSLFLVVLGVVMSHTLLFLA